MVLVLVLVAVMVVGLRVFGVSRRGQATAVGLVFLLVVLAQSVLPEHTALRMATGGSLRAWLILAGVGALVFGYWLLLQKTRARAAPDGLPKKSGKMSDAELDRYARHIILREIGGPGQKKIRNARVLVVGAGGLGSPALMYLAAAGVGTIGVIDDDIVSQSNLQRQVLFRDDDIDMPKVFAAQKALQAQNPYVEILPYNRRLDADNSRQLIDEFDLVLDGTDNFKTRVLVNRACVGTKTPLISGAISQWEGQISVFDPAHGAPCYACIFPEEPADGLAPTCAEAGVVGSLPGVIGSMMATEAIKLITGAGAVLREEMLIYDALYGESRKIKVTKRADCPVCGDTSAG